MIIDSLIFLLIRSIDLFFVTVALIPDVRDCTQSSKVIALSLVTVALTFVVTQSSKAVAFSYLY